MVESVPGAKISKTFPARQVVRSEAGQGLSEYIIIAILVAIIVIVGLRYFGGSISNQYQSATDEIGSLDTGGATVNPATPGAGAKTEQTVSGVSKEASTATSESKSLSGSSSRKGGEDLNKEIARLRPEGIGQKKETDPGEIELDWNTLLLFGVMACIAGVFVVFQSSKKKKSKDQGKKKKKFNLFPKLTKGKDGQAMVEFCLVCITFLFSVMGVIQLAMCLNAYSMVRYAAYNAARAGIVHSGDHEKMHEAARLSLVALFPHHGRADHARGFIDNYMAAKATDQLPGIMTYYFFKKGSLTEPETITTVKVLNNNGMSSGETVTFDDPFDANKGTLTVQVEHLYELVIPLVNRILFYAYTRWRETGSAGTETLERMSSKTDKRRRTGDFKDIEYRIPILAHYTMRLQSDYVNP